MKNNNYEIVVIFNPSATYKVDDMNIILRYISKNIISRFYSKYFFNIFDKLFFVSKHFSRFIDCFLFKSLILSYPTKQNLLFSYIIFNFSNLYFLFCIYLQL